MPHPSAHTLWRYARGRLPAARRGAVRRHVDSCSSCGIELRRAVVALRLVAGRPASEPRQAELDAWEGEILARLRPRPQRLRPWTALLAAASIATVAVVLVIGKPLGQEHLVARGSGVTAQPPLSLRLLCVVADGPHTQVIDAADRPCPVGSYLKVLVGAGTTVRPYVAVLIVTAGGVRWLYPGAADAPLRPLPPAPTPFEGSKHLVGPFTGRLRVAAVAASDRRLTGDDPLLRWLAQASPGIYRNVHTRADAVVVGLRVTGANP